MNTQIAKVVVEVLQEAIDRQGGGLFSLITLVLATPHYVGLVNLGHAIVYLL